MCAASKIRRGLQQGLLLEFLENSQGKQREWELGAVTQAHVTHEAALLLAD